MVSPRKKFIVKWRRAGLGLRVTMLLLGLSLFGLLVYWQVPEDDTGWPSPSIIIYTLTHFILVVLLVLVFLVGRNIAKLIFDRRKGILGSQLRLRLVAAFVGITLIPTILVFVLASGLLNKAMEGWFGTQVEGALQGALGVARAHYSTLKDYGKQCAESLVKEILKKYSNEPSLESLKEFLEEQRKSWGVYGLYLLTAEGKILVFASSPVSAIEDFKEPDFNLETIQNAIKQSSGVLFEEKESSKFIRAYTPLVLNQRHLIFSVTLFVNPDLFQSLALVNDSFREYEQLKIWKKPLKSSYLLTLAMITGLLIFAAIWIAFYMARAISTPIQRLADATRSVAKGRYDVQVREVGNDEMGVLVRSFNQMTADLKHSREENERRRIFIETILSNLAVGVIGVDIDYRVTSVNGAAAVLCNISDVNACIGKHIKEYLATSYWDEIVSLLQLIHEAESEDITSSAREKEVSWQAQGREVKVLLTAGVIRDSFRGLLGYVLLFDDITELSKAQHMTVWREVARRIAHEIKNPLTPIQLSAQRLSKIVQEENPIIGVKDGTSLKVVECTQTIVENVSSIKRLADEFSNFARMPQAEFNFTNFNKLISDTLAPFAENHSDIVFQFIADNHMPEIRVDAEQIRRIVINLVDNAIAALREYSRQKENLQNGPRIIVRSSYDRKHKTAQFEVADNGPGIKQSDKLRIFEPYYTTKRGGTGLGLAIVTSIVTDHQGQIRVYDNSPRGTKFIIDLPANPSKVTQRRFAT